MSFLYNNDTQKTEGRVEWMLAQGRDYPLSPHLFLLLSGKEYAVSDPYTITTNNIFDLFTVLEGIKQEMTKLYS